MPRSPKRGEPNSRPSLSTQSSSCRPDQGEAREGAAARSAMEANSRNQQAMADQFVIETATDVNVDGCTSWQSLTR
jgi:hypothetical protein